MSISLNEAARRLGTSRQAVHQKVVNGALDLTAESVERYRRWRAHGHTGHPPQCPGDCRVNEYAELVGCSTGKVYFLLAGGRISGQHRHGKNWFMPRPQEAMRVKDASTSSATTGHRLHEALKTLGYSILRVILADRGQAPPVRETVLYTNGIFVHCVVTFANGRSDLYLQAGDPTMLGVDTQIAALRALHCQQRVTAEREE